ncbi:MAG: hypothetical protein ACK5MI_01445 [Mangrovibacterium sp.]
MFSTKKVKDGTFKTGTKDSEKICTFENVKRTKDEKEKLNISVAQRLYSEYEKKIDRIIEKIDE